MDKMDMLDLKIGQQTSVLERVAGGAQVARHQIVKDFRADSPV